MQSGRNASGFNPNVSEGDRPSSGISFSFIGNADGEMVGVVLEKL